MLADEKEACRELEVRVGCWIDEVYDDGTKTRDEKLFWQQLATSKLVGVLRRMNEKDSFDHMTLS